MSKINLSDATSLSNETSFISLINTNNATIETESDNFLSLDGTSPNSMAANLDMNNYRIVNLPEPVLSNDPVRLQDMVTFTGGGSITAFPTTSAGVASAITDETGSGSLVFGTSPTLATPTITSPTISGTIAGSGTYTTPTLATPVVTTKISPQTDDGAPLGDTTHNFSDLFLASGGVINWNAGDVTMTHSSNLLAHAGASSGYTFDAVVKPSANDAAALGASGTAFSDLFLASGAVMDWNAGDVTLTHSSNALAFAGATSGYSFDTNVNTSTYFKVGAPSTQTGDFSVTDAMTYIICNKGSSLTMTLPTASSYTGRMLHVKTLTAQTVVSASSNVCPNTTNTPGTAILPATAGAWCQMVSDGTNWIRMASSTIA